MSVDYMTHGAMTPALDNIMRMIINNVLYGPENDENDKMNTDTDTDTDTDTNTDTDMNMDMKIDMNMDMDMDMNMDMNTGPDTDTDTDMDMKIVVKYKDIDYTYKLSQWKHTFYNFIRSIDNDDLLYYIIRIPDEIEFSVNYYDLLIILIDFTMRSTNCNRLFRKICSIENLDNVFNTFEFDESDPDYDMRTTHQKYFRCRFVENLFIMLSNDRQEDVEYLLENTFGDINLWCNNVDNDMYTKTKDVFDMLIPFDIPTESKEKILLYMLQNTPTGKPSYKIITSSRIVFVLYLSLKFEFKNAQKLLSIFKNYLVSSDISFKKFFEFITDPQFFEFKYPNKYYYKLIKNNCDLCFNISRNDEFCTCLICKFIKQRSTEDLYPMEFVEEENRPYYEHNYFMKYNGLCDFCSNIINHKDHIYFNNFRINSYTWYYVYSRLLGPEITDKYTYDSLNLFEHKLISVFYDDTQFKDKLLITHIINNIDAFCLVLVKLYFHTTEYKMHEFRQNYFLYMDRFVDLSNIRKQFDSSLEEQYNKILLAYRGENNFVEEHYHIALDSHHDLPFDTKIQRTLKYLYPRLLWMFKNHIRTTIMGTNVDFTHYLFKITYPHKDPTVNNLSYFNFILDKYKDNDYIQKSFNDIIKRLFSKLDLDEEEKNKILLLAKKHMENNDFNPIEKQFKITT